MTGRKSAFDRWDIDPRGGPSAITARLRELAEDADDSLRDEIRAAWEELTLHPRRRFEAALDAFPETRVALPAAPPFALPSAAIEGPLDLPDLIARPRLEATLPPPTAAEHAMLGPPPAETPLGR